MQAEVVEVGKRKAGAGVKESVTREIVEEDAALAVIGIEEILEAQVNVVDEMLVSEVAVVAKGRAIGELEIVPSAAQRSLASEKRRMWRWVRDLYRDKILVEAESCVDRGQLVQGVNLDQGHAGCIVHATHDRSVRGSVARQCLDQR